jgi:hypothetical protein
MTARRKPTPPRELRRRMVARWRTEGSQGQTIGLHRSMLRHVFPYRRLLSVLLLPLLLTLTILLVHRSIFTGWNAIFSWAIQLTESPAQLSWTRSLGGLRLGVDFIWLEMDAGAPSQLQWWGCALTTLVLSLVSLMLPMRWLPVAYLLRMYAVVIAASLLYFSWMPNSFTHSLPDHVATLLLLILLLALLAPWVFALTFNILGFSLAQKTLLSVLGVGFLLLFAPLHAFSHALLLHHGSLLYQPMLFLLLGVFPPMMVLVALYAWAMTWRHGPQ